MKPRRWIKAASVRALKTGAQTAAGLMGTAGIGLLEVNWVSVLSVTAMSMVLSVLNSVAGLPEVEPRRQGRLP